MIARLVLVALVAVTLAACGKHRVATQPDLPPLAAPPPPPHVVAPPEPEQPPPPPPEPERRAPRRPARSEPTAPKSEPPKPAAAKPDTVTPPAEPPKPSTLQINPPGSQQNLEDQARALLRQARADLGQVKPKTLNADGRAQFDTASRFVEQADQALREQNFVLAQRLADKAATIAAVLAGR